MLYYHLGDLVFNESGVYECTSSTGFYDLDIGINLLHVVIFCCVTPLEECIYKIIAIHHGPCDFHMCFDAICDAANELQNVYAVLCAVGLLYPLVNFSLVLRDGSHWSVNREYNFLLPSSMFCLLQIQSLRYLSTQTPPYQTKHIINCCFLWV